MFTRRTMLEHHLQYDHYPPVPTGVIPFAEAALEMAADGRWDDVVTMPHGDNGEGTATLIRPDGREVTVAELIEDLHLDGFLEDA